MDLEPVLSPELLALGQWLTEDTLCFKISAYQAMLPAALKAKYEKKVKLSSEVSIEELPEQLHMYFENEAKLNWEEAVKCGIVPLLQREAAKGSLK